MSLSYFDMNVEIIYYYDHCIGVLHRRPYSIAMQLQWGI